MPTMAELVGKEEVKELKPHLVLHELSNVKMFVPKKQDLNFVPAEKSKSAKAYYHKGFCLGFYKGKKMWYNVHYYDVPKYFFGRYVRAKVEIVRLRAESGVYTSENVFFQGNEIDKTNKLICLDHNPHTGYITEEVQQHSEWFVVVREI